MSIWRALPGAICWGMWKERNSKIFENKVQSHEKVVTSIYESLFEWASDWANFEDCE